MTPAANPQHQPLQPPFLGPPPEQHPTLEEVAGYVRAHIAQWIVEEKIIEERFAHLSAACESELRERMIRVEEELRHQRELMKQGFDLMEKRFEAMDKRFEAMDRRFETMSEENNRRFDAMSAESNRRFDEMNKRIDRFMRWSFGVTIGSASLVIAVVKFL